MDNSKTSYTLCSSSSANPSQKVRCSGATLNLTEKLYLARQKLIPLIDNVMKTSLDNRTKKAAKPYYLTLEQYQDVLWASQILKEVDEICINLKNDKCFKKNYNVNDFDLEKNRAKVNKHGKIHVDTSILIQMIELHNTVGDIINHLQQIPTDGTTTTSNDVSSYTQTESSSNNRRVKEITLDKKRVPSNEKLNVVINLNKNGSINVASSAPNGNVIRRSQVSKRTQIEKEMFKLDEEPVKEKSEKSSPLFVNDIVIMSAYNGKDETCRAPCASGGKRPSTSQRSSTSQDRNSNSEIKISISKQFTRKTKSAGSLEEDDGNKSKVTDAAGARDIIIKCISDLKKIRSYFDMENSEAGVSAEIQVQRSKSREKSSSPDSKECEPCESDFKNCTCIESGPVEVPIEELLGKDGNASKLIICIKGKTEEEDVQIVIRRCSDCKNVGTGVSSAGREDDNENLSDTNEGPCQIKLEVSDPRSVSFDSEEAKRNGINVIFDPQDPSKSIVKSSSIPCPTLSKGKSSTVPCPYLSDSSKSAEKSSTIPCPYLSSASKLAGKSSTVPCPYLNPSKSAIKSRSSLKSSKGKAPCPFLSNPSMDECKSDCPCPAGPQNKGSDRSESRSYSSKLASDDQSDQTFRSESCSKIKLYETTNLCFCTEDGQELIISLTIKPKSCKPLCLKDIFSESKHDLREEKRSCCVSKLDRVIPLARTKVCSSLEFDVAVMDTSMRSNGITHLNPNIVVRLKELGVNNLLRACRPVKCGRPAVLNETMSKGIPYSASLLSLPLDDNDADIISQSLNMSLNKIKQSNMMFKEKMDKVCFTHCRSSNGKKEYKAALYNPIHKVLDSKETHKKKKRSKQGSTDKNLHYYINLVHDVDSSYKEQTYEIMFFEIKRYNVSTTPTTNEESELEASKIVEIKTEASEEKVNLVSNSAKVSEKGNFDQTINSVVPKTTFRKLASCTNSLSNPIENCELKVNERNRNFSRIPVYKFRTKSNSSHKTGLDCDSDIYDISLHSLPADGSKLTEDGKIKCIERPPTPYNKKENNCCRPVINPTPQKANYEYSSPSTSCSEKTCILMKEDKTNNTDNTHRVRMYDSPYSFELYFNDYFQPKKSEQTLTKKHSSKLFKKRKKKSQFRLASTRSGTFQTISNSRVRDASKENDKTRSKNGDVGELRNDSADDIDFQDIMCSFKSAFYEYLIRNSFLESKHNILRNVNSTSSLSSCKEGMSNKDLKTAFNEVKQRIIEEVTNKSQKCLSQPNVEAGMERDDVKIPVLSSNLNSHIHGPKSEREKVKKMRYFDGKSCRLKRSTLLPSFARSTRSFHTGIKHASKGCQISDRCFNEMKAILERNKDMIGENLQSCDTFENFIVSFDSNTSTNMSSSKLSFEDVLSDYIRFSMQKKIPASSKGLEGMMKIMEANSWLEMDVEPVRYFVYQNVVEENSDTAQAEGEGERKDEKTKRNDEKLYCGCPCPAKSTRLPRPKKVIPPRKCRICSCQLAPPESAFSKCSTCLKNLKKGAEETFRSKILPPIKRACEKVQNSRSAGVMCVPQSKQKAVGTSKGNIRNTCRCTKCDKWDENGYCSCSHCEKYNEKGVDVKTACTDKGIQCACRQDGDDAKSDHEPSAPPDEHAPSAPPDEYAPSAPPASP